jgi:peptidoglycan DL-endopeptidase CwlO
VTVSPLQASPNLAARHQITQRVVRCAGLGVAVLAVFLLAAPAASAEPASIVYKKQQLADVQLKLQSLDSDLSRASDAYNVASTRLAVVTADLTSNQRNLTRARRDLRKARRLLESRLVALYKSGPQNNTLDVVLGSTSLADAMDGVDTANRVSHQTRTVLERVATFRKEVQRRGVRLKRAKAEQASLVRERAAQRASIQSRIAESQQLAATVQGQLEAAVAAEARRQAELKREAEARIAEQQQQAVQFVPAPVATPEESHSDYSAPEVITSAPPSQYGGVVGIAMQYLGIPYVYGGSSPSGFDCSGFVMYVYGQMGVSLPHYTVAQYGMGVPVGRDELQAGDLVFFDGLGHVGIYIGGNEFIHSPHTGDVVKISSMTGWYADTYVGARRI